MIRDMTGVQHQYQLQAPLQLPALPQTVPATCALPAGECLWLPLHSHAVGAEKAVASYSPSVLSQFARRQ